MIGPELGDKIMTKQKTQWIWANGWTDGWMDGWMDGDGYMYV